MLKNAFYICLVTQRLALVLVTALESVGLFAPADTWFYQPPPMVLSVAPTFSVLGGGVNLL